MVKSGIERADKFAIKMDAYVLMLRSKRAQYMAITNYEKLAFEQYKLDQILAEISKEQSFLYGQRSSLRNLAFQLYWNNVVDTAKWLAAGLPLDLLQSLRDKIGLYADLYAFCSYPESTASIMCEINPFVDNVYAPLKRTINVAVEAYGKDAIPLRLQNFISSHSVTNTNNTLYISAEVT